MTTTICLAPIAPDFQPTPVFAASPRPPTESGFTLLEALIAVAIAATVLSTGIPTFLDLADRYRLHGAAETLYAELQRARIEAIKRNQSVRVSLMTDSPGGWCLGLSLGAACDCRANADAATACHIGGVAKTLSSADHPGITLRQPRVGVQSFSFAPTLGFSRAGRIELRSPGNRSLRLVRSALGRLRVCSPDGTDGGYPAC